VDHLLVTVDINWKFGANISLNCYLKIELEAHVDPLVSQIGRSNNYIVLQFTEGIMTYSQSSIASEIRTVPLIQKGQGTRNPAKRNREMKGFQVRDAAIPWRRSG